jgi:hypothetical protein
MYINWFEYLQLKKKKQEGLLDQNTDKMSNMDALILRKRGDWVHQVSGVFATQSITFYQSLAW